jgi:L-threonylcarbamoyladenylate synthase
VFSGELAETFGVETLVTDDIERAAEIIRGGGIVAFPTETVYGLGANAFDSEAVERIFTAKGRPADNPLIVHVSDAGQIAEIAAELNGHARLFIEKFFPGPLTIVAKGTGRVSEMATCGLETIAFRMPSNPLAQELIRAAGTPLVAPSANISGRPSPTTWEAVLEDLDGRIDCMLKGDPTLIGLESTVVDCTGDVPVLLRAGAISLEELKDVVGETAVLNAADSVEIRSPGLKHKHYSPRARVVIIDNDVGIEDASNAAYIGIDLPVGVFRALKICSTTEAYAQAMFEFFRECDRAGISVIYCQSIAEQGIGTAIMDRLRRASDIATN